VRLVVASTDPATLPPASSWYLQTNLPRPGGPRAARTPLAPADLAEIVRLYGLRQWVEQSYKQVKRELGWADFQVRSDRAIRRHWQLVCCAFSFCWWALGRQGGEGAMLASDPLQTAPAQTSGEVSPDQHTAAAAPVAGEKWASGEPAGALLAGGAPGSAQLARPVGPALALLAGLVDGAPAACAARAP
jgi:hypothetical protein